MKLRLESLIGSLPHQVAGVPGRTIEQTHSVKLADDTQRHYRYVYTYTADDPDGTPVYVLTSVGPVRVRKKRTPKPQADATVQRVDDV